MAGDATLVVHTGGIGDFLLTCPAVAALADEGPVDFAGRPERLRIATAAGLGRAAFDIDSIQFHTIFIEPSERLRSFLRLYDRVICWLRDESGELARKVARCGVGEARFYPGVPPEGWGRHASAYYTRCLGLPPQPAVRLPFSPAGSAPDLVIHAGSGSPKKNCPRDRYEGLARRAVAHGLRVGWSRGPAESDWPGAPAEAEPLAGRSLEELAHVLAGARCYAGNDSGITHLAAAVGCPTVAVFGATDPSVWAPEGAHVRVLHDPDWPDEEALWAAVAPLVGAPRQV